MTKLCAALLTIAGLALVAAAPAQAASVFAGEMRGANEVPPNDSEATGFSTVTVDRDTLSVDMTWQDLEGGVPTAAHIHCCTPPGSNIGVAIGFEPFPAATTGSFTDVFDLLDPSTYTPTFLTDFGGGTAAGARDALLAGLASGFAYTNIHNAMFPGGEIRANLQVVAEPASLLLLLAGLAGMIMMAKSRARALRPAV